MNCLTLYVEVMSTRRASQKNRCPNCLVHLEDCYCAEIHPLKLATKVSIIMHKKERFLTSNTAMLAQKALGNSEIFLRGYSNQKISDSFLEEKNYQPLFLYPDEDAIELTPEFLSSMSKPINLIVPDGTWRQAKKIHTREASVSHIQKVKLTSTPKTIYPLRRQKFEYGLCTLEAIAYALGIIENKNAQDFLLGQLKRMIDIHTKYRAYLKERIEI